MDRLTLPPGATSPQHAAAQYSHTQRVSQNALNHNHVGGTYQPQPATLAPHQQIGATLTTSTNMNNQIGYDNSTHAAQLGQMKSSGGRKSRRKKKKRKRRKSKKR